MQVCVKSIVHRRVVLQKVEVVQLEEYKRTENKTVGQRHMKIHPGKN